MKPLKSRLLDRIKSVGSKQFPVNSKELEKYFGISGQSIRGLVRQLRREGNIIVRDYNIAKQFTDRKSQGEKSGRIIDNLTSLNTLRRDTIKKILTKNKLKTK